MRFTYAEALTDASYYLPLAQAAEAAGYSSMTVADSLVYPLDSDSTYPYTGDGNREFLEDKEFIETFTLIAAMGAVTSTIRFLNRLGLGVGLSPRPEDFAVRAWPGPGAAGGWTSASTSYAG